MGPGGSVRLSKRDQGILCETVALILGQGVALGEAFLRSAGEDASANGSIAAKGIATRLLAGLSLRTAILATIAKPDAFLLAMAGVCDATGETGRALGETAASIQDRAKLTSSLLAAIAYPTVIVVLTVIGILVFAAVAVPHLAEIARSAGSQGAALAEMQAVVWTLGAVIAGLIGLGVMLAGIVRLFRSGRVSYRAGLWIERQYCRVPIFGQLTIVRDLIAFVRAAEIATATGLTIERSFEVGASCIGNRWIQTQLQSVIQQIQSGTLTSSSISAATDSAGVLRRMFSILEQGGGVEEGLSLARKSLEFRMDRLTRIARTAAEPAATIAAGLALGTAAILMVRPLLGMFAEILP